MPIILCIYAISYREYTRVSNVREFMRMCVLLSKIIIQSCQPRYNSEIIKIRKSTKFPLSQLSNIKSMFTATCSEILYGDQNYTNLYLYLRQRANDLVFFFLLINTVAFIHLG